MVNQKTDRVTLQMLDEGKVMDYVTLTGDEAEEFYNSIEATNEEQTNANIEYFLKLHLNIN